MPSFNVLIKPASSLCNLRCEYCFYHDEARNRSAESLGLMGVATVETILEKFLNAATGECTFGFQGGEPLLAGIDYFREFLRLQRLYVKRGVAVRYALQTNGTLLNEEWAAFFAKNRFLVGISVDGPRELHDFHRKDVSGSGTFDQVARGIEILKRHSVEFNVLTVVTNQSANQAKGIYRLFEGMGCAYQQYIPCIDPVGMEPSHHDRGLTAEAYGKFLIDLFDVWYLDREAGKFVYNRFFENLAGILLGYPPESCDMNGACSVQYAIEADGSVYPCDFYMMDAYRLGDIGIDSLEDIDRRREKIRFVQDSTRPHESCRDCQWLLLCRGGCRRYRDSGLGEGLGLNRYCGAYREFFPYMLPRMRKLLEKTR